MINTLYIKKKGAFLEKKAVLTVLAYLDGKGVKKVGKLTLNIAEYGSNPLARKEFPLLGCPDKKARICLSVNAQNLGQVSAHDNMSDDSGGTGYSMGTEQSLDESMFATSQADLSIESMTESSRVIPGKQGKPPAIIKNLVKASEIGSRVPDRSATTPKSGVTFEELFGKAKFQELKAQLSVMEKDNKQLTEEKEDLKTQLALHIENFKQERERLIEHIKELDADIQTYIKELATAQDKGKKKSSKYKKLQKTRDDILKDLQQTEKLYADAAQERDALKAQLQKSSEQQAAYKPASSGPSDKEIQALLEEKDSLSTSLHRLQGHNNDLKSTIDNLRRELAEIRDVSSSKGIEADNAFTQYKRRTDIYSNL